MCIKHLWRGRAQSWCSINSSCEHAAGDNDDDSDIGRCLGIGLSKVTVPLPGVPTGKAPVKVCVCISPSLLGLWPVPSLPSGEELAKDSSQALASCFLRACPVCPTQGCSLTNSRRRWWRMADQADEVLKVGG